LIADPELPEPELPPLVDAPLLDAFVLCELLPQAAMANAAPTAQHADPMRFSLITTLSFARG
jgi:hypothetical protein